MTIRTRKSRRYFAEKFGVTTSVAYNCDAFGHNGSLPQILRGLGFEFYIHTRPDQKEIALPDYFYRWRWIDGAEVYAYRSPYGAYCHEEGHVGRALDRMIEVCRHQPWDQMFLWGVGDHGGGAPKMTRHVVAPDGIPRMS
ncbi:MAG: hypothetical protein M1457_12515 [bacterium]|nr:hypothetical protein [bacterium]